MKFFLGTHQVNWLRQTDVPLFLSARRLRTHWGGYRASGPWALDSGGFTEVTQHGRYLTPARVYAHEARRWSEEIGGLAWCAVQDWMCEPFALDRTGYSVRTHQRLTIDSYVELTTFAPELLWVPVIQGWERRDYIDHVEQYRSFGIDLAGLPLVGLGSVCRRQDTDMVESLIAELWRRRIRLHGFGFKTRGLRRVHQYLASADSLAWSYQARRNAPLPECRHKTCQNCLAYALRWRRRLLASLTSEACE